MPDINPRIIKNKDGRVCAHCTGVHPFLTRLSKDAPCDTPVAFSFERAQEFVAEVGLSTDDIERVPDDTLIVLDNSARKLPQGNNGTIAQYVNLERSM